MYPCADAYEAAFEAMLAVDPDDYSPAATTILTQFGSADRSYQVHRCGGASCQWRASLDADALAHVAGTALGVAA